MRLPRMLPLLFLSCSLKLNYNRQVDYMTNPAVWSLGVFKVSAIDTGQFCELNKFRVPDEIFCEPVSEESSGSGFAVITTKEKGETHIITAAHICSVDMSPAFDEDILAKRNIEAKDFKREIFVEDGVTKIKSKIIAVDIDHDVCLLEIKADVRKKFEISDRRPAYGEEIYNIGAPVGFYTSGAKFFLEGHYVGVVFDYNQTLQQVFSIPGVGGLSGSPLINKEGKVIGMIHSIRIDYPYITFSCTIEDLKNIISHAL